MKERRYIPIERSIINACKEVNEIRAGNLPEISWEDSKTEIEQWIREAEVIVC